MAFMPTLYRRKRQRRPTFVPIHSRTNWSKGKRTRTRYGGRYKVGTRRSPLPQSVTYKPQYRTKPVRVKVRKRPMGTPEAPDIGTQLQREHTIRVRASGKYKKGKTTFNHVSKPSSVGSRLPDKIPVATTHSKRSKNIANASISRCEHRTRIDTGLPMSKTLKRLAQNFGMHKKTYFDTKYANSLNNRSTMNAENGFNQKMWKCMPASCYVTNQDVFDLIPANEYSQSVRKKETMLIATTYLESEMHLYNQNAYFPSHVKLHVIKMNVDDPGSNALTPVDFMGIETWNDTLTGTQEEGTMPERYQFQDYDLVSKILGQGSLPALHEHWLMNTSNKAKLTDSPNFRREFEIVSTHSKKLEPGDSWMIRHRHHTGSGMDYGAMHPMLADTPVTSWDAYAPASYMYVFEVHGVPVEVLNHPTGATTANDQLPYIGTSPNNILFEWRKSVKYINGTVRGNIAMNSTNGASTQAYLRLWTNEPSDPSGAADKEFFAPVSSITSTNPPAVGQTYIPVVTNKVVVPDRRTLTSD